ncbi:MULTISPECIES: class I SAM-dependent methyltransferase [unclassified Rhodococcus (in: high G+C Gram-positive bacteria)]|uniref:class I SAM-dependent methyltransferase n=1 Tax=unclassified Rhodococcus (in: high G+C Gram-positive bacteria) TaxID=192944 RepID=UPI0007006CE0|nr:MULTISPECIES: class I SAM-dependent methyltransferase [unclassified Rhodococcus (in: high G+C Gram-positive bacteria)]KQU36387.1 hypothetical protein ASG69_19315 [Rhodococcus sp. Leaf225]KQU48934.1 hypothetical protein ASH03_03780 [Rhodococcus sp. Leaf258]
MDGIYEADLQGVSTTTLWTLNERATEAARTDSDFSDPVAVDLHSRIDYPWGKFGKPTQPAAVRAVAFDHAIRQFRQRHPDAVVVALGEGLQTSYWRLQDPSLAWYTVDLQPVIDMREALLPEADNVHNVALSALDRTWMDAVPAGVPTFVSAEGLLMYFTFDEVRDLVADLAARFPGGQLAFDSIPKWFSKKTISGLKLTDDYRVPPMPTHFTVAEARAFLSTIPGIASVEEMMPRSGRLLWSSPIALKMAQWPIIKSARPNMVLVQFD